MSFKVNISKGFDINLSGEAANRTISINSPASFAIKPSDFIGITRPKLLVDIGDEVKAGSPVLFDKLSENIMYCSPISGEIIELLGVLKEELRRYEFYQIKKTFSLKHKKFSNSDIDKLKRDDVLNILTSSGVWPHIIQRPFGLVADPIDKPKAIHISFFDTHPLAPSSSILYKNQISYIKSALKIISKLTDGKVHLNHNENSIHDFKIEGYENNLFSGPHPSGNVGIQIHHIDPVNKGDVVWSTSPQGLIEIGKLFVDGKYDASKKICLVGSEVVEPQYYSFISGASLKNLLNKNTSNNNLRIISGNVLTGTHVSTDGYLGFYDSMVTVIPEGNKHDFLGWVMPVVNKISFQRAFGLLSFLNPKKKYNLDTNTNGELRAFVQTGVLEKVLPMDILITYLIKAILAEDFDEMEELGIYELVEEDVALCEFVDVSKNDLQQILRNGLNLLKDS